MHRLLIATTALVSILMVVLISVRHLGHASVLSHGEILEAGACAQPCWHGIQPGVTTLEQAINRLRAEGVFSLDTHESGLCWVPLSERDWSGCLSWQFGSGPNSPVTGLLIHLPFDTVRVADVMPLFGDPIAAKRCWRTDTWQGYLIFPSNVALVTRNYSTFLSQPERFDPALTIDQVWYYTADEAPPYNQNTPRWQGFTGRRFRPACAW